MLGFIPLIILLTCTPHGDTMKIKSIELSEATIKAELHAAIMDRTPTCAEKIAQLTQTAQSELLADATAEIQCLPPSAVPLPIRDTLFTLACQLGEPKVPE